MKKVEEGGPSRKDDPISAKLGEEQARQKAKIDKIDKILVAVVIVLVIEVGAIIAPIIWSYRQEVKDLKTDQYEFSIERIERLESIVIPTPTLTPTPATE